MEPEQLSEGTAAPQEGKCLLDKSLVQPDIRRRVPIVSIICAFIIFTILGTRFWEKYHGHRALPVAEGIAANRQVLYQADIQGAADSPAPLLEFYVYRATSAGALSKYPFGNVNTANLDGLIWYLMNEVVTEYANGTRCPRKFNISEIHRFKVRTRAPAELFAEGMNFGARFSYDQGMCRGRCFPENKCSCEPDCDFHYDKYGYMVGCNNFEDKYPFPESDTSAKSGVWYALPLKGRCDFPTGHHDCTWSYEHAGTIQLDDLEATAPGDDNCCGTSCTDFWTDLYDEDRTYWRVTQTLDLFAETYPRVPRDMTAPPCDFAWWKWYSIDPWEKVDPWKRDAGLGLVRKS